MSIKRYNYQTSIFPQWYRISWRLEESLNVSGVEENWPSLSRNLPEYWALPLTAPSEIYEYKLYAYDYLGFVTLPPNFESIRLAGTAVIHCFNTLNNCSTSITNQPTNQPKNQYFPFIDIL